MHYLIKEMAKYNPKDFILALRNKANGVNNLKCPYCGGDHFTTTQNIAAILVGEDPHNISLGPHIPSGMLVCERCGHIEFFALGTLGIVKGEKDNGEH